MRFRGVQKNAREGGGGLSPYCPHLVTALCKNICGTGYVYNCFKRKKIMVSKKKNTIELYGAVYMLR